MADTTGETEKTTARKAPTRKASAPKPTPPKSAARKAPATKAAAPKAATRKAPARKAPARKAPARNAPARSQSKTAATKPARGGKLALSIGAAIGAVAATAFAVLKLGKRTHGSAEHVPTDLLGDARPEPGDRAPVDFRPDPTAPIPDGERDAFRPALAGVSAPTLVKGEAHENERLGASTS
ncbi:hypothetical protein RZN05_12810 [Sphingomonas sp. HF-S4]|uniref:Uncharacterized protein n=1 Tax=Sphingomonas agrestis TaxID=3080540 RepID=A0ABU3Y9M6_9SPHN|nr:hypothetical protein [Sphingomonas sp. HF-S4]MDV3457868.1 hypothetical protein [Sphingomonas sp. HF-S4]